MGGALVGSPCRILGPTGTYPNREKESNFQNQRETLKKHRCGGGKVFISSVAGDVPPVRLLLNGERGIDLFCSLFPMKLFPTEKGLFMKQQ